MLKKLNSNKRFPKLYINRSIKCNHKWGPTSVSLKNGCKFGTAFIAAVAQIPAL